MSYAGTRVRDRGCATPGYYIRRTCTGEIKDNAKIKIQGCIACDSTRGEGTRGCEMNA